MDRRSYLATTGIALSVAGCLGVATGDSDRPWTPGDPVEDPDGVHHLFVENHTDTTETAWLRVVRGDGATLVDGRYELPDRRGFRFEEIAAWSRTYTVELAIDGEDVASMEWETAACGSAASGDGGSRNAAVRVAGRSDADDRVSLVVDQCDALVAPGVPIGPAGAFRLEE